MNVLFRDTMTVYNYRKNKDSGEETWHRTVVRGVQWRHNRMELVTSHNVQELSVAERITIDFKRNYGNAQYLSGENVSMGIFYGGQALRCGSAFEK